MCSVCNCVDEEEVVCGFVLDFRRSRFVLDLRRSVCSVCVEVEEEVVCGFVSHH